MTIPSYKAIIAVFNPARPQLISTNFFFCLTFQMVLYEYFGEENITFFEKKCFCKVLQKCCHASTLGGFTEFPTSAYSRGAGGPKGSQNLL